MTSSVDAVASADKWNSRTKIVLEILKDNLTQHDKLSFNTLSKNATRRVASTCFVEILQLKTLNMIDVSQTWPQGEIFITSTEKI